MRPQRLLAPLAFLLACGWLPAAEETPEELVSLAYRKVAEGGLSELTQYMHKSELARFQKMMMPVFEHGLGSGGEQALQAFTKGDALEKVREYSPQEFFTRFLSWVMKLNPGIDTVLRNSTTDAIGHVTEKTDGGEVTHVVVRTRCSVEGMRVNKLSVVSLKKDGDKWRLMLTGEIEGIAEALKAQTQRKAPRRATD